MDKKIAILDMDSIAFAMGWGNKIPDGKGDFLREGNRLIYQDKTEEELIASCDTIINDILTKCGCTHYIGFIKGMGTGAHRYKANPEYKGNRPKESPKWWSFVKNYLIKNYNVHSVDFIEVDDAVNIARLNIENSFIVAIDKDLLNLSGNHYNWKTEKWITTTEDEEEFNFWKDMLTGQIGDNVKGLPRVGEVTAKRLLLQTPPGYRYSVHVLNIYIEYLEETDGIEQYYKNYNCLKILNYYKDFKIPEIAEFKVVNKDKSEEGIDDLWLWQTD